MVNSPGDSDRTDDEGGVVERRSADEAFEVLSDETRLEILGALFDADDALGFSDLRASVGTTDSGRFNYHLDRLRDAFVRKTEDGYQLTAAGTQVVGAILAGQYTKSIESDPIPVDSSCQYCGGTLVGLFDDEYVRVTCEECDRNVISLAAPPGAFEHYPREDWPFVAERWTRQEFETVQAGFCPICYGPMSATVERDPESIVDLFDVGVWYSCQRCGDDMFANVEASVISHSSVVAFHYEHGIDVDDTPIWELDWAVQPSAEIVEEDPIRVEVSIELEGDRLVLVLDEHATVISERREDQPSSSARSN